MVYPGLRFPRPELYALHGKKQSVQKNREIEEDTAVLDIVQVVFNGFMDDELTVATQLPKASQALGNREPATLKRSVSLGDVGHLRARADQGHISSKDIPEL